MRLAYVAQHAFHQLEEHQDKTAVEYVLWRFAGADEVNVDDEESRLAPWFICPKTLDIKRCSQDDTAEGAEGLAGVYRPQHGVLRQWGFLLSGLSDVQFAEVLLLSTTNFKYCQLLW